jgi:predicted transcriptional regulator
MATTATTSLELDPHVKTRVEQLAKARHRTSDSVMRDAIEQYVEREEKREQLRRDALQSWEHYKTTGLHLTGKEVDAWLEKLENGEDVPAPECHV